ncbi:MAG: hypothetical protein HY474_00995 [Candidatus Sungbacteria bacterium]|uniref:Uncharacterized protein n=1 Tax=Candidatus Sungiibacteriota bacterium TaxID=2750080 RepID=A0A932YVH0_9BACT|nr:hypothetical protein [Candidatus Sungbacteria bacterium]
MANVIRTALDSLRRRPARERRILAAATYISAAVIITALWASSLERTLSSLSGSPPRAGAEIPRLAANGEPAPPGDAGSPPAPLTALRQAFGTAVGESKRLISELGKTAEQAPSGLPSATGKAGKAAGSPPAPPQPVETSPHQAPAAAGPAEIINGAPASLPYSAYSTARLLSVPLNLPPGAAGMPSDDTTAAADGGNRLTAIMAYNLGELRRTAKDVYEYFTR